MELNYFYRLQPEETFRNIGKIIDKKSIRLAICQLFFEFYVSKKTILNCLPLLENDGAIIVTCYFNTVSKLINWLHSMKLNYEICYCTEGNIHNDMSISNSPGSIAVIIYKGERKFAPTAINVIGKRSGGINDLIDYLSNTQDVVLVIGNDVVNYATYCKQKCRHVLCFADNSEFIPGLLREAVKERDINV